jgi:hypothetical protein
VATKRGRKPRAPAIDIHSLTGLTHDELVALVEKLDWLPLDGGQFRAPLSLVNDLKKLAVKLEGASRRPWTPTEIKQRRHDLVRLFLDFAPGRFTYEEACKWASVSCEGTPAAAGSRMMGRDYEEIEKTPGRKRRSRTYGGRPRPTPADRDCHDARGPEERLDALRALIQEVGGNEAETLAKDLVRYLKVETLSDLVDDHFDKVVRILRDRRDYPPATIPVPSAK